MVKFDSNKYKSLTAFISFTVFLAVICLLFIAGFITDSLDWWDISKTLLWVMLFSFFAGTIFFKKTNGEPSAEVQNTYRERVLRQSTTSPPWWKTPFVWVAAFSVVAFIFITYAI